MGVMSILDKLRTKPVESPKVEEEQVMEQPLIRIDENSLTLEEITFLLTAIKDSTFKVADVELVYNTIIKLQSQFMNLSGTPTKSRKK
jgi:hypothetical protein